MEYYELPAAERVRYLRAQRRNIEAQYAQIEARQLAGEDVNADEAKTLEDSHAALTTEIDGTIER